MRRQRPTRATFISVLLLGLLLGIGLGLLAGWVLWPVEYDDVTPDLLAGDYQLDYAKMIAAGYEHTADLDLARAQLDRLGPAGRAALDTLAPDDPAAARLLADLSAPAD